MTTYFVAYVWESPSGDRYWQAETDVFGLSRDAIFITTVRAWCPGEAIKKGRETYERDAVGVR